MFCSNCGKTLQPGEKQCSHCGAPVGDSRFEGVPYTSAQAKIAPGAAPYTRGRAYTRTTYAGAGMDAQAGEEDARTTYRPIYEGASVPEEIRSDVRAAVVGDDGREQEIPEEIAETVDRFMGEDPAGEEQALHIEGFDISDIRSRPIESKGQSGISPDVSEYMQKIELERERRAERRVMRAPVSERAEDASQDVFAQEDLPEEEDDFVERTRLSGRAVQALKIAAIIVVAAAIVVGAIMWVRHITDSTESAPIEGVSLELYNAGIEKISQHADSTYVQSLLDKYKADGFLPLTTQLEADAGEFSAMMPQEASINDALFIQTLGSIQLNIGNAVTMDALAIAQPTDDAVQASEERWKLISSEIEQLKAAKTDVHLKAIVAGEKITIQTLAPSASPTPVAYRKLTRGDQGEEVKRMQERLWELGFLQDDRDGNFGGNTDTAVKAFQQSAGLDVTGIADSKTLALLYSDDAPRTQFAQATPTASTEPTFVPQPSVEPQTSAEPVGTSAAE